jgi:hypothetical protein
MKGTIENITPQASWSNDYGTFYPFIYQIDGVLYEMSHKTDTSPLKVGDEYEFEIKSPANGNFPAKIKKAQDGAFAGGSPSSFSGGGGKNRKAGESEKYPSFAMSYTKDLIVAGKVELKNLKVTAERIFDIMIELDKKNNPAPAPAPAVQVSTPPAPIVVPPHADPKIKADPPKGDFIDQAKSDETDDLPF